MGFTEPAGQITWIFWLRSDGHESLRHRIDRIGSLWARLIEMIKLDRRSADTLLRSASRRLREVRRASVSFLARPPIELRRLIYSCSHPHEEKSFADGFFLLIKDFFTLDLFRICARFGGRAIEGPNDGNRYPHRLRRERSMCAKPGLKITQQDHRTRLPSWSCVTHP